MSQPAQIMPMIQVQDVDGTREFYVEKLGFSHMMGVLGSDGKLDFCTVVREGGKVMFTRSPEAAAPAVELYFQTERVDDYHRQVSAAGVETTRPENMWWGDRVFIATDPNGLRIWFYETVSDPIPPEGAKII